MTRVEANHFLDFVRAGGAAPQSRIVYALWITGDLFSGAANA